MLSRLWGATNQNKISLSLQKEQGCCYMGSLIATLLLQESSRATPTKWWKRGFKMCSPMFQALQISFNVENSVWNPQKSISSIYHLEPKMVSTSGSSEMSLRKFDGLNFNFWKEQMQDYLIVKGQIDPMETENALEGYKPNER